MTRETHRVPAGAALDGEYAPSPEAWVREEVAHYERTGRPLDDRAVVVLTTVGVRSGQVRKTPVMRVEHRGSYAVVASAGGAQEHPRWYANVLAHPRVRLQDGLEVHELTAREVSGDERSRWWSRACVAFPSYADYQSRTRRRIPLLVLEPVAEPAGTDR